MFNADTELFFPIRVIPYLEDLRGAQWKELITQLARVPNEASDITGFSLMMAKLCGCAACNVDSFRAMRGCTQCARLTIRRYKNTDADLLILYKNSRSEVTDFISKQMRSKNLD